MANGSFNGLYTFEEVANIYNIDASTIRKQVQQNKFLENKEIKKFGKTWLITERAVKEHFGEQLFNAYQREEQLQAIKKVAKNKKTKNIFSTDNNDLEIKNSWEQEKIDPKNILTSFKF